MNPSCSSFSSFCCQKISEKADAVFPHEKQDNVAKENQHWPRKDEEKAVIERGIDQRIAPVNIGLVTWQVDNSSLACAS